MSTYRQNRLNEEVAKALSEILRRVKDRRLSDIIISISGANVAPDLSSARIYYSFIGNRDKKEVSDGLASASGYIRSSLASELDLRHTPKLIFIYDESFEHGARIAELMHGVEKELREIDERSAESEGEGNE